MIYVKMLVDRSVNGFDRKVGEVIKTDHLTAISLVDRGEADFTNDVPKEVAEKSKRDKKSEPESAAIEPEENAMMPSAKPKKKGRYGRK